MKVKVLVTVEVDCPRAFAKAAGIEEDEVRESIPYEFHFMEGRHWGVADAVLIDKE